MSFAYGCQWKPPSVALRACAKHSRRSASPLRRFLGVRFVVDAPDFSRGSSASSALRYTPQPKGSALAAASRHKFGPPRPGPTKALRQLGCAACTISPRPLFLHFGYNSGTVTKKIRKLGKLRRRVVPALKNWTKSILIWGALAAGFYYWFSFTAAQSIVLGVLFGSIFLGLWAVGAKADTSADFIPYRVSIKIHNPRDFLSKCKLVETEEDWEQLCKRVDDTSVLRRGLNFTILSVRQGWFASSHLVGRSQDISSWRFVI